MSGRGRAVGAACALIAVVLAVPVTASSAVRPRFVLAPEPGARLPADPVRIVVRAPFGVDAFRVTLNGTDVTAAFGAPRGDGRRVLRASASRTGQ